MNIYILPLVHLCAAPQYQAETLKCFVHLKTRKWTLDFSIKVTQECKQPSVYFLSWLSPHLWDALSLSWWPRLHYSRWKPEKTFQHRFRSRLQRNHQHSVTIVVTEKMSVNLCFKSVDNFWLFASPAPNPRLIPEEAKTTAKLLVRCLH